MYVMHGRDKQILVPAGIVSILGVQVRSNSVLCMLYLKDVLVAAIGSLTVEGE